MSGRNPVFDEIERSILILLARWSAGIGAREAAEARHFLDHGEYGLAFEALVDAMAGRPSLQASREELKRIASLMNLDFED
ncbi:hypothetical protein [Ancylobacter terrae]|uniref:hypothetical protein n=1 Tax=Ancylobacter sp. sgz301288 TaxID=3342077 RepID=UPI00385809A1